MEQDNTGEDTRMLRQGSKQVRVQKGEKGDNISPTVATETYLTDGRVLYSVHLSGSGAQFAAVTFKVCVVSIYAVKE